MSILEQVKELRDFAQEYPAFDVFAREAADTIETLYTKLQVAETERSAAYCTLKEFMDLYKKLEAENMEPSTAYYNGGWIPCSESLPGKNGRYLCETLFGEIMICEYGWNSQKSKKSFFRNYCAVNVVYWQPLPNPPNEPY